MVIPIAVPGAPHTTAWGLGDNGRISGNFENPTGDFAPGSVTGATTFLRTGA
jgi:hypothetical protein